MGTQKILVLNGHPATKSLNRTLAQAYAAAAVQHGDEVREQHLADLSFDPDFGRAGYVNIKPLEPDLEDVLRDLEWADEIVLTTPMWWGGVPAKLKGLFDRILLPGRAFDPRQRNALGMPKPLLTGKSARIILTSDTPPEYFESYYGSAMVKQLTGQVFNFVGIDPVTVNHFHGASGADEATVDEWTSKLMRIAEKAA